MTSNATRLKRITSRIACTVVSTACVALPWVGQADENVAARPTFTDSEIEIILSHGPWLAPMPKDPSNRVSGKRDAIEFGTRLFFDRRLSGSGTVSCSSCHVPERNWTDNLRRGVGMAEVDRNTPTVANLDSQRWYGWAGAADSLWSQNLRAIADRRELAATPAHVAELVRSDEQLSCRYRRTLGAPPSPIDDEAVFVDVGKALAAFQETLGSGATPSTSSVTPWPGGKRRLPSVIPSRRSVGSRSSSGRAAAHRATPAPISPTASSSTPAFRDLRRAASPIPGATRESNNCWKAVSTLLSPYSDDPTGASAARTRQIPCRVKISASSRCRRYATCS